MALTRLMRTPFRRQPPQTDTAFSQWLGTSLGQSLLAAEQHVLDDILPRMVGYRAVQCSVGEPVNLLGASRLRNHYLLSRRAIEAGQVRARSDAMPFAKHSLDLVLLHHSLDFDDNPHQVLREAARTLAPGGAMVIVGFNPASLAGVSRLFMLASLRMPWVARFLTASRVSDWLNVLGCEPEAYESGFYLPFAGEGTRRRLSWLDRLGARLWNQRGAFYVLVARKRAAMVRPLRQRFALGDSPPQVVSVPLARWQRKTEHPPE